MPHQCKQCAVRVPVLFLRWARGPFVDGLEIRLGANRQIAGCGWGRSGVSCVRTGNYGFRVAHAVADRSRGLLGDARFPGGPVIDAIDLVEWRHHGFEIRSEEHTSE